MKDWLGNELSEGCLVLYTSTSTRTGMNVGVLMSIQPGKRQIKLLEKVNGQWEPGRKITLHKGTSAYDSVTVYRGVTVVQKLGGSDG